MVSINQKDTTFTKIFVGGLPYHTTDETLRKFFERFGDIDEAVVITDRTTGKSRGYGFVTMGNKEAAQEAIRDPNPVIDGRKANVNLAYLGAKPRNPTSTLANSAAALAAANTVIHLGAAYPGLQTYGLQPLLYPTHNLLGNGVFSYGGANGANGNTNSANLSQSSGSSSSSNAAAAAAHFASAYDLANQYNQIQLDAAAAASAQSFPYGTANSPALTAATLAAAAAAASNPNNIANYAYATLAQQAIPSLTAYQQ